MDGPISAGVALLLDCGFGSLVGSANSAGRMAAYLAGRGFECSLLRGPEVTHERVADALKSLRSQLGAGDAFVLYFVGHGERLRGDAVPARGDGPPPRVEVPLLVTHDLFLAADPPRPGITGEELIAWLAPIAELTGNVTLILDCCRAAGMAGGSAAPEVKARIAEALARGWARLRTKYAVRDAAMEAAAGIVRLTATTEHEIAVERILPDGSERIGLFTEALVAVLERPGAADVPWEQLLPELQARVLAECSTQRPGIEGPRYRVPFSARERPPIDEFLARLIRAGWVVRGGRLHGIEVGDRFDLGGAPATVTAATPTVALLRLDAAVAGLPSQLLVRRVACARRHAVGCDPTLRAEVEPALAESPELMLAQADAVATIERSGAQIGLRDARGALHVEPAEPAAPSVARVVGILRRLVRWQRQAPVIAELAALAVPIGVAWGLAGDDVPLPSDGAVLPVGARLRLRAWGTGKAPEVFVSLFHLRVDLSLEHLTDGLDHGVSVPGRDCVDLLEGPGRRTPELAWPAEVPRDGPREEALVLLVSARPRSFHRMGTSTWLPHDGLPVWTSRRDAEPAELSAVVLRYRVAPAPALGAPGAQTAG